jgi:nucleotide-binding universal stress UspA family protein
MYKKILVAVDGSETSKLALTEAVRLAKAFQSTVRAVYIVDSPAMLFDVGYYDPTELRKSFVQAGTALLADVGSALTKEGLTYETTLVETQSVGEDVAAARHARPPWSGARHAGQRGREVHPPGHHAGTAGAWACQGLT